MKAVQYVSIAKLNYKQGSIFIIRIRGEEKAGAILFLHKKRLEPKGPSLYLYKYYSVLIASKAESFMALLAGIYPAITPTSDENTSAVIISHGGITEIFGLSVAPAPPISFIK